MTTDATIDSWSFHRPEVEDELVRRLAATGPSRPLFLAGEAGSGRSYLLRGAVERAGREGSPAALAVLDLEGYEEDLPSFDPFLDIQVARLAAAGEAVSAEHLEQVRQLAAAIEISAAGALLLSLLLRLDHPEERLAALPGELFVQVPDPGRDARERISLLLRHLGRNARRILHVRTPEAWSEPLLTWLFAEAQAQESLRVVISSLPEEVPADAVRLDLAPLSAVEVRAAVDRVLHPIGFTDELHAALAEVSQGLPALLANNLADLAEHGYLVQEGDSWKIRNETEEDEDEIFERLSIPYLAPWEEMLNRLTPRAAGQVQRFLNLAALCGENVPADLLLHYMEVPAEEHEAILDLVDEELVEGDLALFLDHQYSHPGFPGHPIYGFLGSLPRRMLVAAMTAPQIEQTAADLLQFLRQIPVETKGMARLFLELARTLPENAAALGFRRELAWWVGPEEAPELAERFGRELEAGRLAPSSLLTGAIATRGRWPPYRRLALLAPLGQAEQALPAETLADVHLLRSEALTQLGRHAEALADAQRGLELAHEIDGENPRAVEAGFHVALLLRELGRSDEAREPLERLLPAARRLYGEGHPTVLSVLNALGSVLSDLGDLEAARGPMEEVVTIGRQSFGERHPALAPSLNNLAALLQALGEREAARGHFEEALAILRDAYGDGNPSVAMVLHNYSQLLFDLGESAAACRHLEQALEIATATFGSEHSFTVQLAHQREVRCAGGGVR